MRTVLTGFLLTLFIAPAFAHVDGHPSIHDTLASIVERMRENMPQDQLMDLEPETVLALLTPEEREILGTQYLSFRVDKPVTIYIMRHTSQQEMPFWLEDQDYKKTNYTLEVNDDTYEAWSKEYDAGVIGLGINGFERRGSHYFVGVVPQEDGDTISITDVYPGQHRMTEFKDDAVVHQDEFDNRLASMPAFLSGQALIRGIEDRTEETQLVRIWRTTGYPSSTTPDQIVLTWSGDPKTTQTVQWRTNPEVTEGAVRLKPADGGDVTEIAAVQTVLEDPTLVNDAINHRFTAAMTGLEPNTEYAYAVGHGDTWTDWSTFTTAPDEVTPFKFVYMGDAQNGLDTWGVLLDKAWDEEPDAKFYIMAGDLVNRGIQRDDWDSFFHNAAGHYNMKQLVPAIGNHEDQGEDGPWMYLEVFDLPKNGPDTITKERAYSFEYSNALFVILDTNASVSGQAEWLEEQLSQSDATWKFVVYHHPAYSSAPRRNNPHVRKYWGTLFDKYHVDLAMQGHDHGYLRTYPMYDEKRADSPEDGTIYIVSVSGTKFYEVGDFDYSEFSMSNVSTYQVLDIEIDGNKLHYKSYDIEGELRDEFIIEK